MINEETRRKLREINLGEAIKGLEVQQADPATIALPFDERMQLFFVKYFSLKKASEFPFFSKGFSLPSAGIMHPCA